MMWQTRARHPSPPASSLTPHRHGGNTCVDLNPLASLTWIHHTLNMQGLVRSSVCVDGHWAEGIGYFV